MDTQYIQLQLKKWYFTHKRTLPWREISDPYLIWISEIILQQTRVAQGYEYYLRFTERFPDVRSLAEAPEDEVLKMWQGLGYYSRARNLHTAAKQIIELYKGEFPTRYEDILSLKGIGEYTAAAICSFAYQMPYAVLDGNVYRVLARLFAIDTPIDSPKGKKEFSDLATQLLDRKSPDIHNQAMMEFGALQCIPGTPACDECPLIDVCGADRSRTVSILPVKSQKTKVSDRFFNYLLIEQQGKTFLHRRGANDIWQHLYELPLIEADHLLSAEELNENENFRQWCSKAIVSITEISPTIKHVLSHQRIHTRFFQLKIKAGQICPANCIEINLSDMEQFAISRLTEIYLKQKNIV